MSLSDSVLEKKVLAISVLRKHRRVVVALSGGVDSAVLLAIAREALGAAQVLAVTGRSESVAQGETEDAARVAAVLGVEHRIVNTFELARPEYQANVGDRCFHCRTELFEVLGRVARERECDGIAYGAIADDLGDDRPGMRAAARFGVIAPLLEAQIWKTDVRALAYDAGLHVKEKPANACLASRIPMGTEVTAAKLDQVGRAEVQLRRLGFRQLRIRHHGEIARIELGDGEADRLADGALRAAVVDAVRGAGFRFVALDLEGYREGSVGRPPATPLYSILPQRDGGQ